MPRPMRTIEETKLIIKEHGDKRIAVIDFVPVSGPGSVMTEKAVPVADVTLHELIEFIQHTGGCISRHLSGGERNALAEGEDINELT